MKTSCGGAGMGGLVGIVAAGLLAFLALLIGPAPAAQAATITVNTATDELSPNNGHVSLREVITAINAASDGGDNDITANRSGAYGTNDTINFHIIGLVLPNIVATINIGADGVAGPLPPITKQVVIDGYTQPHAKQNTQSVGSDAVLCIVLDGSSGGFDGLDIKASDVTVKGLVIAHNNSASILVESGGSGATIQGNFIGTNAAGTNASLNGGGIIIEDASNVTIGGTTAGARNLVSGSNPGIEVQGAGATGLTIEGNYVGTNAAGTASLANSFGIGIVAVPHVTIGGTALGAGNLISGNSASGISVTNSGAFGPIIQGNLIGTTAAGTAGLANGVGIEVGSGTNVTIGGGVPGGANVIAFNTGSGVVIENGSSAVDVRGNAIFSNGGLGIDLNNDGVTGNDTGDGDPGPNLLQNFPLLTQATVGNGSTSVVGTLNSTADSAFTLDFYANPSCDEPSLHGEGQTYLGSGTTGTNSSGNASFTITGLAAATAGNAISATATDTVGNTSEFSTCQPAIAADVTVTTTSVAVTEGGTPGSFKVALTSGPSSDVTITLGFDAGQLNVSPATLTFHRNVTATSSQTVTVSAVDNTTPDGTRQRQITLTASSTDSQYNSIAISPVTATITDNDAPAILTIADTTAAEPSTSVGTSTANLTVTLAPASTQAVTVQFSTANGTATGGASCGTAGVDYRTTSGTLTFGPGDTSKTISVTICGDTVAESNEALTVALSSPTGSAVLGAHASATLTITNVTPARCLPRPVVQLLPSTGGGQLQVTVQPSPLGTGEANALAEIDFATLQNARVSLNGQPITGGQAVTLPPGTTSVRLTVQRVTPGQATTVPFTVKDSCGEWPTFVGGGTSAVF